MSQENKNLHLKQVKEKKDFHFYILHDGALYKGFDNKEDMHVALCDLVFVHKVEANRLKVVAVYTTDVEFEVELKDE